jgi:peptidoglycan hydrolase-like protein with peptidoglycan-binding domain
MTRAGRTAWATALLLALGCAGGHEEQRGGHAPTEGGPEKAHAEKQEGVKPRAGGPRVPATPEGLLGAKAVRDVQRALADRGLLGAHREGDLDAPTSAAVRKFQEQQGLAATGMPDRETLRALGVSAERAYGAGDDGG